MKICNCKDWKPNIDLINSFIVMGGIHGVEYAGKSFEYCPWCGKKLEETEDSRKE